MSDAIEQWRPVPGFEGRYEVSDHGQVRSLDQRVRHGRGATTRLHRGRILSPSSASDGRRRVILYGVAPRATCLVSVLVLKAFVGSAPPGHECCHYDGDASNDRLTNLSWGTRSRNILDRVRHGTHNMASRSHCPRGHLLAEPNLTAFSLRDGSRICLACNRARACKQHADKLGEPLDFVAESHARYAVIMGSGAV